MDFPCPFFFLQGKMRKRIIFDPSDLLSVSKRRERKPRLDPAYSTICSPLSLNTCLFFYHQNHVKHLLCPFPLSCETEWRRSSGVWAWRDGKCDGLGRRIPSCAGHMHHHQVEKDVMLLSEIIQHDEYMIEMCCGDGTTVSCQDG